MLSLLFVGVTLGLSMLGAMLSVVCWLQIRSFVQKHAAISDWNDFDELKQIVKVNMYASLIMIVIAAVLVVGSGIALWFSVIGVPTLLVGLCVFGGFCGAGGAVELAVVADNRCVWKRPESPGFSGFRGRVRKRGKRLFQRHFVHSRR